jgi:hypothetical protein
VALKGAPHISGRRQRSTDELHNIGASVQRGHASLWKELASRAERRHALADCVCPFFNFTSFVRSSYPRHVKLGVEKSSKFFTQVRCHDVGKDREEEEKRTNASHVCHSRLSLTLCSNR